MPLEGGSIDPTYLFRAGGLPEEVKGPIDVKYMEYLPNASAAKQALDFLRNATNDVELRQRHTSEDMARMWRAVFRACIAHAVPIPNGLLGYARRLGVVVP